MWLGYFLPAGQIERLGIDYGRLWRRYSQCVGETVKEVASEALVSD